MGDADFDLLPKSPVDVTRMTEGKNDGSHVDIAVLDGGVAVLLVVVIINSFGRTHRQQHAQDSRTRWQRHELGLDTVSHVENSQRFETLNGRNS